MEKSDNTIQAIDKTSVHNICSGQVILNLASAVKELVENSLDAGATSIEIFAKEYGSESIEVIDNGRGVEESNFEGLTLKHHTSKLSEFSDLTNVETFGFRGEALSSLCALSNMTIVSCHKDSSVGSRLEYNHDGVLMKHSPTPRQVGTTVILKNLFYTLPVRHKEFHSNLQKEFNKMLQLVTSYCLICTNTRLSCTNQTRKGKNLALSTAGGSTVKENIACIFGSKQLSSLMEFHMKPPSARVVEEYGLSPSVVQKTDTFRIEGYVSSCKHGQGRSSSDRQYFYINSRPFDTIKISRLVNEVYHSYNRHQYPFVFLNIIAEKSCVDVNVTPDKRQIFIENEKLLLAIIKSSLEELYEPELSNVQCRRLEDFQNEKNIAGYFSTKEATPDNSDGRPLLGKFKRSLITSSQEEIFARKYQRLSNVPDSDNGTKSDSRAISETPFSDREQTSCRKLKSTVIPVDMPPIDPDTDKEITNSDEQFTNKNISSKYNVMNVNKRIDIKMLQTFEKRNKSSLHNNFSYLKNKSSRRSLNNNMMDISGMFERSQWRRHSLNSSTDEAIQNTCSDEKDTGREEQNDHNLEECVGTEQKQIKEETYNTLNEEEKTELFNDDDRSIIEVADKAMTRSRKCVVISFTLEKLKDSLKSEASNIKKTGETFRRFRAKLTSLDNKNAEEELNKEISKDMFAKMKIIGQFNKGFIVTKLDTDLFIIDQHATDEKYNYEMMKNNTVMETQKLLCPQDLNLTAVNKCVLLDNLDIFKKNGFSFTGVDDTCTDNAVHLTSVPVSHNWSFGKEDVEEMIFMLNDCPGKMCRPSRMYQMFASRACRMSVMIGTSLSYSDMRKLVDHMGDIEQPWNCPHGRPTMRHLFNMALLDTS